METLLKSITLINTTVLRKNYVICKITLSGRPTPAAIFVMGMAEVFVATMQCSGVFASISLITLCLILMSSKTASITRSAFLKESYLSVASKPDKNLSFVSLKIRTKHKYKNLQLANLKFDPIIVHYCIGLQKICKSKFEPVQILK